MSGPWQPPSRQPPVEPYPDVRGAFMLTLLAMLCAALVGVFFIELGTLVAVGIGQAVGVGAIATMAARRVPEPQAERLGLRGLDAHALPAILCLAPAILLASELDNFAVDWSGSPVSQESSYGEGDGDLESLANENPEPTPAQDGEGPLEASNVEGVEASGPQADTPSDPPAESKTRLIDPEDSWSLIQAFIIFVGIAPVVEEFLFRGVIQQGLLARLGLLRGISMVALLWTLLRPAPVDDLGRFVATAIASFGLGWVLGVVRVATGSILGSILLASLWGAVGLGSLALEGRLPLPGMNVEGTHLPWTVSLASAFIVAWSGWTLYQEADQRFSRDAVLAQREVTGSPDGR